MPTPVPIALPTLMAAVASESLIPGTTPRPARTVSNLAFTHPVDCGSNSCQVRLDVYQPAGVGPFPEVVLVHGGPSGLGGRAGLSAFARQIAAAGYVVFNTDTRDNAAIGGGYPGAFQDLACAVRFARASADEFGGDAARVALVGHSLGGFVGSVVALDDDELGANCLADGSGRPDAFVGLAGNYNLDAPEVSGDLHEFFGGAAASTAAARSASDPFNYALGTPIPVRLVAGTSDGTVNPSASVALNAFLTQKGWDVSLNLITGATHVSLVRSTAAGQASLEAIRQAVAAAGRPAQEG